MTEFMSSTNRWVGGLIYFSLSVLIAAGCARQPVAPVFTMAAYQPDMAEVNAPQTYWWPCRFKIAWPAEVDLDLSTDLMLAHGVVGPVLAVHSQDLKWWRFHRRAARDEAGHQFSFMFYSDAPTAAAIIERLDQNPILNAMMDTGLLERYRFPDPAHPEHDQVAHTSDPNWSPALQRNWPSFIMGVSALWLGLIDDLARQTPVDDAATIDDLLDRYRRIDAKLTHIWHDEGQHALLHHLNAIFGYEPMRILKELRF